MRPEGPACQSCGMPLNKDEKSGGTNADGTRSAEYCSHCFQKGKFTEPAITVTEMVEKVRAKLSSMNLPAPMVEKMASGIPSLKRWKKGSRQAA